MIAMPGKSTHADLAMLSLAPEVGSRPFYFRKGSSDEGVIEQTFAQKHHDLSWLSPSHHAELATYVRRSVADGARPLIVDAGANIGASSVFFAFAMPGAKIVAIEPDAANADILRMNVDGLDVDVLQAALASAAGRSKVIDPGQGHWGFRTVDAGGDPAGVPNVTIPEIYARHQPGFFPAIVKIDIEGAEKDAFRDSLQWVRQTPVIIVELHDWLFPKQRTSSTFLEVVAGLDRDFITVGDNILSIANDLMVPPEQQRRSAVGIIRHSIGEGHQRGRPGGSRARKRSDG
jgi:FkbM family methyltransferase